MESGIMIEREGRGGMGGGRETMDGKKEKHTDRG